jgi:hypothetical protein
VVVTLAAALATVVPGAQAQDLAAVRVDQVRVRTSGLHRVWVSVLDGEGRPMTGLDPSGFTVTEDGHAVDGLEAKTWSEVHRDFALTVVVDASLLAGSDLPALERTVTRLGSELGPAARLRLAVAGAKPHTEEVQSGSAERLAERLGGLAGQGGDIRLYDALLAEERHILRRGDASGAAILIVTRGADAGSRAGPLEALALLAGEERRVPVLLLLLDERGAPEAERLARLALRTGGAVRRAARSEEVQAAALELLPRARGAWRLSYRVPGWDAKAESHRLEIRVEHGGRSREVTQEFLAAESLLPPWWRQPGPWVWLAALLIALAAAALASRRRALFLLVVESGPEEGSWFEVYGAPITLGAAHGNDLLLFEPLVSRNHAVLERRGRSIEIVDLNSENGTFVNGERVSRRVLADGDTIRLGASVELTFQT